MNSPSVNRFSTINPNINFFSQADSTLRYVDYIRSGISSEIIDSFTKPLHLSKLEIANILQIPLRTLARRKKEGVLNREESEKVVRLGRIYNRACEVFADKENAVIWLKSPNASLEGVTPISLLDTDVGGELVNEVLGKIEHGVFS